MPNQSTETQIALLIEGQKALQRELVEVQDQVAALETERNKALKWGVLTLGSAVISLVVWIGNKVIGGHIQ